MNQNALQMEQQIVERGETNRRFRILLGGGHNQFRTLTFSNSQANLLHHMYGDLSSIDDICVCHSGISMKIYRELF